MSDFFTVFPTWVPVHDGLFSSSPNTLFVDLSGFDG